jgi:hypothetical protein
MPAAKTGSRAMVETSQFKVVRNSCQHSKGAITELLQSDLPIPVTVEVDPNA